MTLEISRHCSAEGSTPVGLCAHACNKNMLPSGAVLDIFHHPFEIESAR